MCDLLAGVCFLGETAQIEFFDRSQALITVIFNNIENNNSLLHTVFQRLRSCVASVTFSWVVLGIFINPATFGVVLISAVWMPHQWFKPPRVSLKQADPFICAGFSRAKKK